MRSAVTTAAAVAVATATETTTTTAVALATGGHAVDAGAGRVGLTAGFDRFAARQVESGELRGLERVDVARQLVAITAWATVTVGVALAALTARALATLALPFGARAAGVLRAVLALALALSFAVTA